MREKLQIRQTPQIYVLMNLVSEQQFQESMQDPRLAAELTRMLVDDLAVAIAIVGGPEGNTDMYHQFIQRILPELLAGAEHAQGKIKSHLQGRAIFIPGVH